MEINVGDTIHSFYSNNIGKVVKVCEKRGVIAYKVIKPGETRFSVGEIRSVRFNDCTVLKRKTKHPLTNIFE